MTDTEDHRAAVLAQLNGTEPLRSTGYYYSIGLTGTAEVDVIVSAINQAGKACHHTEDWFALGLVARIETAAKVAAERFNRQAAIIDRVVALHTPTEDGGPCPTCFVTAPCKTGRAMLGVIDG